jgi:two-component system sensor histidine kinase KdpD
VPSVPEVPFPSLRAWFEREGIRSFIGVPLVVQGKAIGSLNVYSRRGQRFDPGDLELLQALAAQAAIALEHAHLYESVAQEKAKLEALVEQLHQVERLKSGMLSTVSHELRTPLAAIKGFATSLLRTDVEWDEASQRDFVEQIDAEADRLDALVRNLLDMSRVESGSLRLDREWCDLADLLLDVVDRMSPVVGHHQVHWSLGQESVLALVDRRYLERVIWNLVENAVKYSPRGSMITLGLALEGQEAVLSVRDQGIGIRPEEQDRIFERFYRGVGARTAAGIGLGLSICRGIVEAHGGTLRVQSAVGSGSLFSVRLPLSRRGG